MTNGLECSGCGSSNVTFDSKRRILICNQCGKEEYYSRATLNRNNKVILSKRNAIASFVDGRFEDARHYALEVLNISLDNASALYIMAYYDEFEGKKNGALTYYFSQMKQIALEYEEVEELRQMFLVSAYKLMEHEADMIELIAANMQSSEDREVICEFIDKICPYLIAKRSSTSYLTDRLAEMYRDLAKHCDIPKTCFALIKSIETNPESPFVTGGFYLEAKTRYFYDHYISDIGLIIENMRTEELRRKFLAAFQAQKEKFRGAAGISE